MSPRRVGVLFGVERQFPPALVERINAEGGGRVVGELVSVGAVRQEDLPRYDVILDRISHEVPFYRTWLKAAVARGTRVVNNPFWWSADDKFLGNVIALQAGVAVPKTVLVPHKHFPPNTKAESYTNLEFPLDWEAMFEYLGFPIFLKPAYGGGWRDVYRVQSPAEFFQAYDGSRDLLMIAQEGIRFTEYYRCYGVGREKVRLMAYDPSAPFERRYVRDGAPIPEDMRERLERDCLALCRALGYDFNTLEFAVRDGVPYAIDFMNPAPDCDRFSVGDDNFEWVLSAAADFLIRTALEPGAIELAGDWPRRAERRAREREVAGSDHEPLGATVPDPKVPWRPGEPVPREDAPQEPPPQEPPPREPTPRERSTRERSTRRSSPRKPTSREPSP